MMTRARRARPFSTVGVGWPGAPEARLLALKWSSLFEIRRAGMLRLEMPQNATSNCLDARVHPMPSRSLPWAATSAADHSARARREPWGETGLASENAW